MEDIETVKKLSKYINDFRLIAHRMGYLMQGYPENSMANITSMFGDQETLDSIDGIEFEIRFTRDNVPVILHDTRMGDICDTPFIVEKTDYKDLKDLKCGFRKSTYKSDIPWDENKNFNLLSLEEFLVFLMDNRNKLVDKIIKIETKEIGLTESHAIAFKELLKKYEALNENIVHLSFLARNLKAVRELQVLSGDSLTRIDLLVDNTIRRPFIRNYDSFLDVISLGIKEIVPLGEFDVDFKTKLTAKIITYFSKIRNGVNEEWMRELVKTRSSIGIYTINDLIGLEELFKRVSEEFLDEYASKIIITTANPKYIRSLCK